MKASDPDSGEDVLHLLHRAREVVVGVQRAAVDLGPAVLAGQPLAGEVVPLMPPRVSRMPCMPLVVVGGRGAAGLDAMVPPSGLISWAIFARLTPMS